MTQAEVAGAMGVSQQRVSAIESGSVAELATLADYIRALGGELTVIADFGDSGGGSPDYPRYCCWCGADVATSRFLRRIWAGLP